MMEGMQLKRLAGLLSIIASGVVLLAWGSAMERRSPLAMSDLYPVYYHARILIEHEDPYLEKPEPYVRLRTEGFLDSKNIVVYGMPVIPCVYPPSSLIVLAPLALVRWQPAHLIWMGLISACLTLAGILIWSVGFADAPFLSAAFISFVLLNSETLIFEGNSGAIAAGLCIIAVWCFMRQKATVCGAICLAVSLALKPHDSALVWLCLLLCGGIYRKRALQTLIPTGVLLGIAIAWVGQVSPHWQRELAANIASISSPGSVNDPGPHSSTGLIINSAINAQTVFAVLWDHAVFYNLASYVFCGVLLLLWFIATRRSPITSGKVWLSLAFISALSMLPVYHRHHDSKLLMLAVPACVILWARGGFKGKLAVPFTAMAVFFNSDVPRAILTNLEAGIRLSTDSLSGKLLTILLARPAPLAIMAMAVFYLWVYWRVDIDSSAHGSAPAPAITLMAQPTS